MRHEEDGRLMAYVDGELAAKDVRLVETHLGECPECARATARLHAEKGRVATALSTVDVSGAAASRRVRERLHLRAPSESVGPAPRRRSGDERAGATDRELDDRLRTPPVAPRRAAPLPRRWRLRTHVLQAAVFVLFIAGGAAALVPGSPLRRWLQGGGNDPASTSAPALMRTNEEAASASELSSVSATPAEGRLRIVLQLPAGSELRVVPVDGERATVFAAETGFESAPGLLRARVSAGPVRVELPRDAEDASLEVNGQLYVRAQLGEVRFTVPASDSSDAEVSFRIRGP